MRAAALSLALLLATPAMAESALPKGATYIIQLTSSQYASGMGEYLVPPLAKAMGAAGLKSKGGPGADFAATVESESDVGAWYDVGGQQVWLYTRTVTVGLSPADADIEPEGKLSPWFSVGARLRTENEDRVDELNCLVALAGRELAARYKPKGHVLVDGSSCGRKG